MHKPDGLTCPRCTGTTGVIDSRAARLGDLPTIRRRRRCRACDHRFTTYELDAAVIEALDRLVLDTMEDFHP